MEARLCSLLFAAAVLTLPAFATQRPVNRAFATLPADLSLDPQTPECSA